ncbi:MAG: helix-turn-helix domain-containing protein [Luteolibacter sp.]|uniref:helix-turn-helix domain-containing protein n=1 Tax=Luteolibacter sp. TaxID=1962973 RepID=UPI00326765E5
MKHDPQHNPEWIDTKEVKRIFSIGKTTLYHLTATGKVRTVSLRESDKLRGKRLFSVDSIRRLLEGQAQGGAA